MIERIINGERTDYTPVWFMRQAGRYMKNYLKMREQHSFLEICLNPELSAQTAIMPVKKFNFDAAIFFSDILLPFLFMGAGLDYNPEPLIDFKLNNKNIKSLKIAKVDDFHFAAEALINLRKQLPNKDIIGFVGSPFTLLYYLLNQDLKAFYKLDEEGLLNELMNKITSSVINFAISQLKSKINIIQIFDTKANLLNGEEYRKYSLPYNMKLIKSLRQEKVKVIYFFLGGLKIASEAAKLDADCFSVDYSDKLSSFYKILKTPLQGNLRPEALLGEKEEVKKEIKSLMDDAENITGHIFNLGHGILKNTPEYNVSFAVDFIHNYSKK